MPAPTGTALVASSALTQDEPWTRMSLFRGWANGGTGVIGTDLDRIRALHFPRPQVYPETMYGEFQDVYATARVSVVDDTEMKHRQIIFGECLNQNNRVRIAGASRRIRCPNFCRIHISATLSHRTWVVAPYAGPSPDPTGYFTLFWGVSGNTPREVPGARRPTIRHNPATVENLGPPLTTCNMLGVLDSSDVGTPLAPGGTDVEIFAAFVASASTFFAGDTSHTTKNPIRVDVLNTSLVVRVWKNVSS